MDLSNTIIITVPSVIRDKIPIPSRTIRYPSAMDVNSQEEDNKNSKSRKRKLENLSMDEKLLRKKMKNRVAAQNSRDKKKARMDELEYEIEEMRKKTQQLSEECQRLRLENDSLHKENDELRLQNRNMNAATSDSKAQTNCKSISSRGTHNIGPAAFSDCVPLLKGRDPRLAMAWQAWCCAWGLLLLTSTTQTPKEGQKSVQPTQLCSFHPALPAAPSSLSLSAQQKWWGPHQSTWNPVKS